MNEFKEVIDTMVAMWYKKNVPEYPLMNKTPIDKPSDTQQIHQYIHDTINNNKLIQVSPNIYQSVEDYKANMQFDEMRDNELQDRLAEDIKNQDNNIVY